MKRRFEGLHQSDLASDELPDGLFLVRVNRVQYHWHAQKPYYSVRFSVLEPKQYMGRQFTGRVYCTTKGLWKLTWFLRDFSYHNELMGRDEIDDNALVGLRGVVRSRIAWLKALPYTISTLLLLRASGKNSRWERAARLVVRRWDGRGCLLEWKTTSSRYPEEPQGLLALDPQLVCYSWVTGISEVAQIVFVRKRLVEIQYLHTTITDEQRREFSQLVHDTIGQIESAQFLPHSGIRFPQNPCSSCPYIGLCLDKPKLVEAALIRKPGAEHLGWLDELNY